MVAAAPRVVDRIEGFLGGEIYHYNSKMMLKEPRVGGAWEWHQDYGYWYQTGCLYPYGELHDRSIVQRRRTVACKFQKVHTHGAHRTWTIRWADWRRSRESGLRWSGLS